MMMMSASY